eukprot:CAMPEP_0201696956 /NCGR_PEP_ID=MMETSP0578-20130828/8801_1 /ASSEMBLY_ACC=CAM_ASM_000663 /TAXON_ID=267565 /ORGANISM="Skeletonema grethea, Strain CCMP 1804" /LENGTH=943 /DNA_ID=CAMNT_0048182993 /DNA_START=81 /DNA_END=2912 /DNA_ORIENTATION=-
MKLVIAAYLLATSVGVAKAQTCVQGLWNIEVTGTCDYATILAAYEQQVFDATGATSCADGEVTAEQELNSLLTNLNQDVETICKDLYDNAEKTEFYEGAGKGTDYKFEEAFYNGHSKWVEEVETTYESADGSATSVLREDAASVNAFYQGDGSYGRVTMPPLENFEQCDSNAVMCCWPKDRQAADNNGNCNRNSYSENCVDKDPADNTNLCSVDLAKGTFANGFDSDGITEFPGDGNDGEGAIHCHGYAWANDEYDPITRYKANNLFYVSMYDHMHQRGYVENIPGAPMCGCVEKMPMATRSDCTQVDLTEDFSVVFDGSSIKARMDKVEIDFNACQGKNGRNNDLYAYHWRLYEEGKVDRFQFGKVGRTLTDDSRCRYGREYELAKKGLQYGYKYNEDEWTQVAGNDGMEKAPMGENAFNSAYEDSTNKIIHRTCGDCTSPDHKHIYYRRFTAIPDNFGLLYHIMNEQNNGGNRNVWNVDFQLYSTYEDAVNDTNRWKCPNNSFNYGAVFYGECSPSGARVRQQYLKFSNPHGSPAKDVGFYVDKPSDEGVQVFRSNIYTDQSIGAPYMEGSVTENDGVYHMTCGGSDIWGWRDEGHFKSRPASGDIEVVVRVDEIAPIYDGWAKSGVMLRSNYDDNAVTAFGLLSGHNGVALHTRVSKGNYMQMPGGNYDLNQKNSWLKLVKIGSLISFYSSDDGENWTLRSQENVFFPEDQFLVGLACTSHSSSRLSETTFSNFSVTSYAAPTGAPTVSAAPTAWEADKDIGEPVREGEYWADVGGGITKIRAGGSGIWGTNDSFFSHFYQRVNDDFTVTAYVHGFGSGTTFAKGGLMIRDGSSPDATNVFIGAMGAYKGIGFQSRESTGAPTVHHGTHWVSSNQAWIKLIKTGDVVQGLYSTDGAEWTSLGTKSFTGAEKILVGYAATVGNEENSWNYADLYIKDYSIE